jgi:hypothetical protein
MEKITVRKDELLEKLRANRADHRRIFEEALDGFRRDAVAELERRIADIRNNKREDVQVFRSVPKDHTSSYDRAIAMIEMSVADTIVLSEADFARYVMDDWGWQRAFVANSYGSQTASGKFSDRYTTTDG